MDLQGLLELYQRDPRVQSIVEIVEQPSIERLFLKGLVGSSDALIATSIFNVSPRTNLFILENKEEAAYFKDDLKNLHEKKDVLFFPDSFKKAGYFDEINRSNILLRTESITRLTTSQNTGEYLVTYPEALLEKVVDSRALSESTIQIKVGQDLETDQIVELLVESGFDHADFVYEPGQFSVRGGIIDIFSFGNDLPYRVELFDMEVESLRIFDPSSQFSEKKITQLNIVPNIQTQFSDQEKKSLLDILPSNTLIWIKNAKVIQDILDKTGNKALEAIRIAQKEAEGLVDYFEGEPEGSFVTGEELEKQLENYTIIEWGGANKYGGQEITFQIEPQPAFNKNFNLLIEDVGQKNKHQIEVFLFGGSSRQINRLDQIFKDLKAEIIYHPIVQNVAQGFVDRQMQVALYTDHQIFDRYYKYNIKQAFSKNKAMSMKLLRDLQPGDYVTHLDHGVGKYSGLEKN